jgi:hypothetical protein
VIVGAVSESPIPEPATALLLAIGLPLLFVLRQKRRCVPAHATPNQHSRR